MTLTPGDRVIYHHRMLERDLRAIVESVAKQGIRVRFDDPSEPAMHGIVRYLTRGQAAVTLSKEDS